MSDLTGTVLLTRLALRRDRVQLPAWIIGISLFVAATTALFVSDLSDRAHLEEETRLVATNAGMRMLGLTSGATAGGYMLHREFLTLAVLAALMSTLAVVRHTRQNEELGRAELLGATVVGRYAGLAAAVLVAVVADVVLALALGAAILVNGQPAGASLLAGASVAAVGLAFTGVAAVTVQLSSTTRGATGAAGAVLGLSFLLSGVGNMLGTVDPSGWRVDSAWPVWFSPIGWGQQTRPFSDAHWWPLGLAVLVLVALVLVAAGLANRRDVGRGMWAEHRGRARATAYLHHPAGLIWRLQRGALVGWSTTLLLFGLIFGSLIEQVQEIPGVAADFTAGSGTDQAVDAYRAFMMQIAGMFVAIYVVQVLLRMRVDEAGGTWEPVLASGVTRARWAMSYVLNVVAGATLLVTVYAVGMAVAAGRVLGGTASQLGELTVAGLVQLPATLLLGAVVVLVVGALPRWASAVSWSLVVAVLVAGPMFAPGLGLDQWVQDLSPFTHTPLVPATDVTVAPLLALSLLCLGTGAAGVAALRRRDSLLPA